MLGEMVYLLSSFGTKSIFTVHEDTVCVVEVVKSISVLQCLWCVHVCVIVHVCEAAGHSYFGS